MSSPDLFHDLYMRANNCCGTVTQNHKGISGGFDNKTLKLKWGDIHTRVRGHLAAMV